MPRIKVQHIDDGVSSNPFDRFNGSQGLCVAVPSKCLVSKTDAWDHQEPESLGVLIVPST